LTPCWRSENARTPESRKWLPRREPLSTVLPDLEIYDDAEMIASPDPIGRLVEGECGPADAAVRTRVSVPRADEHIVNPAAVLGLPYDLVDHGPGVWVLDSPRVNGALAGHGPRVVIVDAMSTERLEAGQVADARRVRGGVDVAGDDGGKRRPMTSVEIRERDDLSLAGRLGIEAPRTRGRDEQQVTLARKRDRDRQRAPGNVRRVR
jgi:hypothetical protein